MESELNKATARIQMLDREVRYLYFIHHKCVGRYGDDGEMQCNKCMLDFRRDSLDKLRNDHIISLAILDKLRNDHITSLAGLDRGVS